MATDGSNQSVKQVAGRDIACAAVARSGGSGEPTNREVARYWIKVVEANKHHLRSGNPDLIYPDEEIILPPVGD